jgi:diacylglycerol kinase family enzyme
LQTITNLNTKPLKYFLILNPGSRAGNSKKKFNEIFSILESYNIQYKYQITEKLEDAYKYSLQANTEGFDAIVAVGGDGTINNVINGFYNQDGKKISEAVLGVIYTGTSPDFCKSYKIPLTLKDAIITIIKAKKKKIKIGKIELCQSINKDGVFLLQAENRIVKYFSCCVNVGLGATVASRANSGLRKYLGDFFGTLISLIISVIHYKPGNYMCKYNGQETSISTCFNLSIGITPFIASGIKVPARTDSVSQFYLMGACKLTVKNMAGILKKIYRGIPFKNNDSLWIEYTSNIEISNNIKTPNIEFDGDPAGYLPCSICFAQDDLDVLVDE